MSSQKPPATNWTQTERPSLTPEEWQEFDRVVMGPVRERFANYVEPRFPYDWTKAIQIRGNDDL